MASKVKWRLWRG